MAAKELAQWRALLRRD